MIYSLTEMDAAAKLILESGHKHTIWCFYGEMGAGKTTLISTLLKQLGVTDTVSSPSFSIVNEYQNAAGLPIYHFDFYRINSIEEVYDLGFEDYFDSGYLCLIEWPEKIADLLVGQAHLKISLSIVGEKRKIELA